MCLCALEARRRLHWGAKRSATLVQGYCDSLTRPTRVVPGVELADLVQTKRERSRVRQMGSSPARERVTASNGSAQEANPFGADSDSETAAAAAAAALRNGWSRAAATAANINICTARLDPVARLRLQRSAASRAIP